MADVRVIFDGDDSENEEFLGFDQANIEEAEERYVRQLDNLRELESDIEISEIESSEDEDADSDNDSVSTELADWSDHLRPVKINHFSGPNPGPTTNIDKEKREIDFLNLLFPEKLYTDIANETNAYAQKCILVSPNKTWYPTSPEEIWM